MLDRTRKLGSCHVQMRRVLHLLLVSFTSFTKKARVYQPGRTIISVLVSSRQRTTEMAFPGMGGMGMGGRQGTDPQQMQEQQMIKYVSKSRLFEQ
jgi:hypothetical protein